MNVIGRLIPSLESQVNLKRFRGVSTSDALYRMSGVRITGLLGSMTAIYGFSIDIFEDIQKEINNINDELNRISDIAKRLKKKQLEYEEIVDQKKKKEEKEKKEKEKKEKKEKEKKGKEEKDKNKSLITLANQTRSSQLDIYSMDKCEEAALEDDKIIIDCIMEFGNSNEKKFMDKYEITLNKYKIEEKKKKDANNKKKEEEERKRKEEEEKKKKEEQLRIYEKKGEDERREEDARKRKELEKKKIDDRINMINFNVASIKEESAEKLKRKEEEKKEQKKEEIKRRKEMKEYAYDFAYEYQYSMFEDECLKTILKQRAEKFNFSAQNSLKAQQNQQNKSEPEDQKKKEKKEKMFIENNLLKFVSTPISDNEY